MVSLYGCPASPCSTAVQHRLAPRRSASQPRWRIIGRIIGGIPERFRRDSRGVIGGITGGVTLWLQVPKLRYLGLGTWVKA